CWSHRLLATLLLCFPLRDERRMHVLIGWLPGRSQKSTPRPFPRSDLPDMLTMLILRPAPQLTGWTLRLCPDAYCLRAAIQNRAGDCQVVSGLDDHVRPAAEPCTAV